MKSEATPLGFAKRISPTLSATCFRGGSVEAVMPIFDPNMARRLELLNLEGVFYFNIKVPKYHLSVYDASQIRKSLGTSYRREASDLVCRFTEGEDSNVG